MWGVFKSERLSWRCMWLLWYLPHLEVVIALDLWPERRIYSLLICANCQPSAITATSIGDMVALKSWNGSRAVSHKIAFGSAELSGRFTSKWDRISFPSCPMHLLMGWNYLSFFLTAWLSWPVHTRSRVTLSGSYSCRQSCHLLEENPLCLVMMGILLPALPHLFITLTYRSWVFVCLLQNCASVVSGEHEYLIAFLGVGQLFPDVHDQAIASHFCRLFPVYLCLLCLQYVSLDCNGAIGKTGCRV